MMQVFYDFNYKGINCEQEKRSFSSDYLKEHDNDLDFTIMQTMISDNAKFSVNGDLILDRKSSLFSKYNDNELKIFLEKYEYQVLRSNEYYIYIVKKTPTQILSDILSRISPLHRNDYNSILIINYDIIEMFTSLSKFMEYIKQFNSKWIQCEYCEEVGMIQLII